MKTFRASTTIEAAPETIWAILTDATRYPEWDSGVDRIDGSIALGEKIAAHSKLRPGRAFPVNVREFVPSRKMVWSGGLPLGLFKGERTFTLTPRGNGVTEFTLSEVFSGPLLPVLGRSIPDLTSAFEQFAADLKRRAEGGN